MCMKSSLENKENKEEKVDCGFLEGKSTMHNGFIHLRRQDRQPWAVDYTGELGAPLLDGQIASLIRC